MSDGPSNGGSDNPRTQDGNSFWRRLRDHYEGSVVEDLVKGLGEVEFGDQIIIFGASFLLSVLPLILLLGFFANSRVDDNIATRLGLNAEGSHIVEKLFATNTHPAFTFGFIVTLALSLAGTIAGGGSGEGRFGRGFSATTHPGGGE